MRRIVWSESALAAIAYIAERDAVAAERVAKIIEQAVLALGRRSTGRPGRVGGTFEKSVPRYPYVIAYALEKSEGGIERLTVLRVIHTSRNWPRAAWPKPG